MAGLAATLGRGAMSNPLRDMEQPDVIFAIGTNMTECHPVAATRLKKAMRKGAKLIVADPRGIRLAEIADIHLPLRVGSDVALLSAMAHVIARDGLVDGEFIDARTEGADAFFAYLEDKTPEWAATITGLDPLMIEEAARWYGNAERGAIYYTLGITEHICGVDNVQSLSNLALMTGNLGKEGTGINPMRGQNNIQGAGDAGALPNNYCGFQSVLEEGNRRKFSEAYGIEMDKELGITKVKALDKAAAGELASMLIVGENTVVSDPDRGHCEKALKRLDHLVVVDIFMTETGELADVVLPATSWAETDGVFVNTERRVQRVRQAVKPPGEAKPEWWILAELGKRMGRPGFDYSGAQAVFDELCSLSPIYAGIDWEKAGEAAYQWPVPYAGHKGTPRLHEQMFPRGKGLFKTPEYRDPAETISRKFPLWLTTGRRLQSYHTHTMTGRSAGIDYLLPEETLELHPNDVDKLGLKDGGRCKMASARGAIELTVKSTTRSPPGTVFSSFSFSDTPVNILTGGGYDPNTDTAEVKVCPVRVEPA